MIHKKQKIIVKKLKNIQDEIQAMSDNPETEKRVMQAVKLIYCAERILLQKELIQFENKAGDKK